MTAEVALLNKHGVALAADSAVTVTALKGQKIYNAGNKLFALSKRHPVGVMVYGNAEFMGVPWETIIKVYRSRLGDRSCGRIDDYFADFLTFLGTDDQLFGDEAQELYVFRRLGTLFFRIREDVERKAAAVIEAEGSIDEARLATLTAETIRAGREQAASAPMVSGWDKSHESAIRQHYADTIREAVKHVMQQLPLTAADRRRLTDTAVFSLSRANFPNGTSGLVIAGFGTDEHFPALRSATLDARIAGKLKHKPEQSVTISHKMGSAIVPFAQTDAVTLFVEGIDPAYTSLAYSFVRETLLEFPKRILDGLNVPDDQTKAIREHWEQMGDALFEEFRKKAEDTRRQRYVNPLLNVVAVLPKDELAAVAEALVNLTSLRRKISLDAETVGGPIDVAVISKGDGLVWIQRKHYFRPELNQHFFQNYFRAKSGNDEQSDTEG